MFALAGGCDTFADGYDPPPTAFGGSFSGSFGGSATAGGSVGFGGTIFVDPPPGASGGTGGASYLCPPGGSGGSSPAVDGGMGGQAADGGANAGGQAGAEGTLGGEGGMSGISGASGEAGMNATGGSGGSGCPASEPVVGPCSDEGRACMYGDPINLSCRKLWTCFNGLWSPSRSCTPAQQNACPQSSPTHAAACTEMVTCAYPDGNTCECTFCNTGSCWACNGPPARPANCPQQPPLVGGACSIAPVECAYGECFTNPEPTIAVCCHGAWSVRPQSCPTPIPI